MKKLIALALAVMLLASMAVSVSAESTTTLTATVPAASYTLNIPANQEIPFGTTRQSIGNVTVTDASGFAVGKNLDVTITYDTFAASETTTQIPYTLSLYAAERTTTVGGEVDPATQDLPSGTSFVFNGKADGTLEEVIRLAADYTNTSGSTTSPVTDIYFNAKSEDWGKALAGEYTTTITFTAEVVVEG